jgi:ribosomal protein S18 acetylase RimI-like enzyme
LIKTLNLDDNRILEQILTVQQWAYGVESKILGCEELPPLNDTKETLRLCGETFLGCFDEKGVLAGFLSYKQTGDFIRICRLAVSPSHFRKGVASRLLETVFKVEDVREWGVTTGKDNLPAIRCYEKHGFVRVADRQTPEGIMIVYLRKQLTKNGKQG